MKTKTVDAITWLVMAMTVVAISVIVVKTNLSAQTAWSYARGYFGAADIGVLGMVTMKIVEGTAKR